MGKRRGKKGKTARNANAGMAFGEPEEVKKAPHSFVISRGKLGKNANELLLNFRKLMEPYTASDLKVLRQNILKDFVHIAGPLKVTHLIIFTKSDIGMYLRILKLPHGPTLTFQIKEYTLSRDVLSSQKKPVMNEKIFEHHPLLVLNNFTGEGMHFKLMTTMFQNMFPSINVNKTQLNTIKRCLLLQYNEDKTIDLRQYAIKVAPTGMSKAVKKLIESKVPDLSHYKNVSDFLQKSGNLSESEAELDTPANTVVLPQPMSSRGNIASEKSSIKLYEIGPRITFQLVKIEEGLMTGEVLFHEFITKTKNEIKALRERQRAKKVLKKQRREQQEKNVEKKKKLQNPDTNETEEGRDSDGDSEREEDINWYRKEVGKDPDEVLLPTSKKRKLSTTDSPSNAKKHRRNPSKHKHSKTEQFTTKKTPFQEFLAKQSKKKAAKQKKLKQRIK